MKKLLNNTAIVFLSLTLSGAAWAATLTGTQPLNFGQNFSFDSGTVVASGGDINLSASGITLQGSAAALTGATFGQVGMTAYNGLVASGPTGLSAFASFLSTSPIPSSALTVNAVFGIKTVSSNLAVFIITATSSTSITFQFTSFVTSTAPAGPTITQVINNYSLIPAGFTNSGIAQGALFIIKGSGLASATSVTALNSSAAPGLPTTYNGATVNVTVGSTTTHPVFYYAEAIQLALVMPSNTPVGAGTVTVTYNGQTSAPFNIQVVASAFGFLSNDGSGAGLSRVVNITTSSPLYYSYTSSIPPGTTIELFGSGLGADPTRDTTFSQTSNFPFSINTLSAIYIGGIQATIVYQGASGYPGLNQINVTVPSNAQTGCNISMVGVSTSGVPTNFVTLAIGPAGSVCQDPAQGINGTTLTSEIGQANYSSGSVELFQSTTPATSGSGTTTTQLALADFQSYTGSATVSSAGFVSVGGCIVIEALSSTGTVSTTGLNAGTITVTGPAGSGTLTSFASISSLLAGLYESANSSGVSTLPAGFIPASGGTFTFTGTGGTTAPSVGPFNVQIVFPDPLLQWTNQAAAAIVTRSAGQLITWTGGAPGTYVSMTGFASSGSISGNFTCIAPVAAMQFTIPSYVLATLPASNSGTLSVGNSTTQQSFTATGITYGSAIGAVSYQINATYQ
jgi:uncharacterized protein (TIGR03437 family)